MKLETRIKIEYRKWCKDTFDNYKVNDFPCQGRMFEIWRASWHACMNFYGSTK